MIIDRIIRQKRKGDMSLYREYQQNDAFKAGFRTLIIRMLDNIEYLNNIIFLAEANYGYNGLSYMAFFYKRKERFGIK